MLSITFCLLESRTFASLSSYVYSLKTEAMRLIHPSALLKPELSHTQQLWLLKFCKDLIFLGMV